MIRFLWFIYIRLLFFYTKFTYFVQKLKKIRIYETHGAKLNSKGLLEDYQSMMAA